MSSLRNKLKKLSFFTHYPKKHETLTINNNNEEFSSKEEIWEEWLGNNYVNGIFITDDITYYDQTELEGVYSSECTLIVTPINSGSQYQLGLMHHRPSHYSLSQSLTINGMTNDISSLTSIIATVPHESAGSLRQGTLTVVIPSYYDSTNKIYYSGVQYTVEFNITNDVGRGQSFPVTYI